MPTFGFTLHSVPQFATSKRMIYTLYNKNGEIKEQDSANQSRVIEVSHEDKIEIHIILKDKEGKQL